MIRVVQDDHDGHSKVIRASQACITFELVETLETLAKRAMRSAANSMNWRIGPKDPKIQDLNPF